MMEETGVEGWDGCGGFHDIWEGFRDTFLAFSLCSWSFFLPPFFLSFGFFFWAPLPAKSEFLEAGVIYG